MFLPVTGGETLQLISNRRFAQLLHSGGKGDVKDCLNLGNGKTFSAILANLPKRINPSNLPFLTLTVLFRSYQLSLTWEGSSESAALPPHTLRG